MNVLSRCGKWTAPKCGGKLSGTLGVAHLIEKRSAIVVQLLTEKRRFANHVEEGRRKPHPPYPMNIAPF